MTAPSEANYMDCPTVVVEKVAELAVVAIASKFRRIDIDANDIELLVDALHVLRPHTPQVDALSGALHMVRSQWNEAGYVLRQASAAAPDSKIVNVLLEIYLEIIGEPAQPVK